MSTRPLPPVTIIGCGYIGTRLAARIGTEAQDLTAVVRSEAGAQRLRNLGINTRVVDVDREPSPPVAGQLVFYFVPPPRSGQQDERIGHWLDSLAGQRPIKIVLISTTGTYGNCDGRWITEDEPLNAQTDRARRRVDAEQRLQSWCSSHQVPFTILRVPGIYGPGRLPRARLERRLPVLAEAESPYSNRIHADDLVRCCLAAAQSNFNGVVHVSDGHPSSMTDYFIRVADALGLPRPEQISMQQARQSMSQEMLGYLAESKRLDITRMRSELGVDPEYPDLDRGLQNCIDSEPG